MSGAHFLTAGASSVARRFGVSDLVVGLTIVAFGTSAPELVISVISAAEGNAPMALGNIVGSNIFNILMIVGVTATIRPIVVNKGLLTNEIPMVVLSAFILLILGNSGWLEGSGINEVTRANALLLIIFFVLFMRYTFAVARKDKDKSEVEVSVKDNIPFVRAIVYIVGGLAALLWGGDKFVEGAAGVASELGVSDAVIGLTIVAGGTSLPELATSVVAALKGNPGIAVGNVIGSNIFNTLLVTGVAGTITPLPFGGVTNFDLLTLTFATVAFYLFGWFFGNKKITRWEGIFLTAGYIAYIIILLTKV